MYTPGIHHVYVPYWRVGGDFDAYFEIIEAAAALIRAIFKGDCFDPALRVLCHYYLPPCGNSTTFESPTSVCMETCYYLQDICPNEWEQAIAFFNENDAFVDDYDAGYIECNDTGD